MKKIGMRTIKTGIAVFFATLAGYIGIISTPVYTVSVCIFSLKNTMKNSVEDARSRILGTLLGGLIGFLFTLLFKGNIITTTIGVILVIHLCNIFNISDSAAIASVTFTAICIGVGKSHPLEYSITRTMDTLIGVLIALIVNYGISRHKYIKYLSSAFESYYKDFIKIVTTMADEQDYSSSYNKLNKIFVELNENYNLLIDELTYSKDSAILNKLYNNFDTCEQLLHNIQGLYLIDKKVCLGYSKVESKIHKYYKDNIIRLLSDDFIKY